MTAQLSIDPDGPTTGWSDEVRRLLADEGAVLLRGIGQRDVSAVGELFGAIAPTPTDDVEAFAQRRRLGERVYSSAAWPNNQPMCMHHELSYRRVVPGVVLLACTVAPVSGGRTGRADAAAVLAELPADLVGHFERDGWVLERTLGGDIGPGVADAFGTDDRAAVDAYCGANGIGTDWLEDGTLRTRQRRPAVITHPKSGRRTWFNQVAFLSEWTLDEEVRDFLVEMNGEEGLPFRTFFGDGTPIGPDVVATINAAYDTHTVGDPWRAGDLLVLDNLATAHSREAFTGPREVLVGLADPQRIDALAGAPS